MLSYCTNVHQAETLAGIWESLALHAVPLKRKTSPNAPLGVGLYLPAAAAEPLANRPESAEDFRAFLARECLAVETVNAFPYGGFHAGRVKDTVYRPDWTTARRLEFTLDAGKALASLLPAKGTGSVSTLPGSWKAWGQDGDRLEKMAANLLAAAEAFRVIREETGKTLTLCLEPEPGCTLETTAEAVTFFKERLYRTRSEETARRHLGICLDTCHLAVQFEDLTDSIRLLTQSGIRIGKAQLSSALAVRHPGNHPEAASALRGFEEERWLHQVVARTGSSLRRIPDLPLLDTVSEEWLKADEWRCHFHVPLDRPEFPPLLTTQAELKAALPALLALPEPPHMEIETYTWSVLPESQRPKDAEGLVEGLAREFAWVKAQFGAPARQAGRLF